MDRDMDMDTDTINVIRRLWLGWANIDAGALLQTQMILLLLHTPLQYTCTDFKISTINMSYMDYSVGD